MFNCSIYLFNIALNDKLNISYFPGLYRGFVPAMLRVLPQTLITFLLMEQLRTRYGVVEN